MIAKGYFFLKRDMDLWRKLLLTLEEKPLDKGAATLRVPDYDEEVVDYHLMLLEEKCYIKAVVINMEQRPVPFVRPQHLTATGHELVELMRDDTVWNKAKKEAASRAGSVSLDMVASILTQVIKGGLGLP